MNKTFQGRRVYCNTDGSYKLEPGDYAQMPDGFWMARVPDLKFRAGDLSTHDIVEHEDGSITVSPSILHTEEGIGTWHGFLEKGIWRQ